MISKLNSCFEFLNNRLSKNHGKYFVSKLTIADLFVLATISTIIVNIYFNLYPRILQFHEYIYIIYSMLARI